MYVNALGIKGGNGNGTQVDMDVEGVEGVTETSVPPDSPLTETSSITSEVPDVDEEDNGSTLR